ncbi:MAG: molybdenum cofactor guanylyltransferase [Acidobacteria bacterium]|nr:molybdenum cofactor guanylyltransferase [Acidobacteriota bacterium]
MGSDKAFLAVGGRTLLERAFELASSVAAEVRVVAPLLKCSSFGTLVKDIFPGRGPLGGIHAALSSSPSDWNLILAVDLPFVEKGFLNYLVGEAQRSQAVVTVPRTGGRFEPLCAVYRKQFAGPAESALAQGRNKIDALFPSLTLRVIDDAEMARRGHNLGMFRNLNTPEDWEQARQELAKA